MAVVLAVVASLALLLALVAFVLADFFCSVLCLNFRRNSSTNNGVTTVNNNNNNHNSSAPTTPISLLSSVVSFPFYGHGVLQAPTAYLLTIPNLEAIVTQPPQLMDHYSSMSSVSSLSSSNDHHFVCNFNPIYDHTTYNKDNEEDGNGSYRDNTSSTPFETPETSPSRLECEGEEESECSPPLMVMKKLPAVRPIDIIVEGRHSLSMETYRHSLSSSMSNGSTTTPSW